MVSRIALLREIFRTKTSKVVTGLLAGMAAYQFACDQFGAPTLPNLWGMSGAGALPWWAWLLLTQIGFLYGLFEYVRQRPGPAAEVASPKNDDEKLRALDLIRKARSGASVSAYQGSETNRAKAFHEIDAAMLAIENKFGIKRLNVPRAYGESQGHKAVLELYVRYVDTFYPLLREGFVEQARQAATDFKDPWAKA